MPKRHAVTTAEILEKVKDHVAPLPSQEGYMKSLAGLLAMHLNRNTLIDEGYAPDALPVPSCIVVAPTGQGKTYLLRKMVRALDLNLITVDCSTLVGENYKGVSLSQRIAGAMEEAKDEKSFHQSVLFLDEADKLCRGSNQHSSGMTAVLQLFNGDSITISRDDRKAESVDVSRFLIILAGAFMGLEEIVCARLCPRPKIGFDAGMAARKSEAEYLQEVTADDLEKFGLMRELLGRLGTILVLPPLGLEDYMVLLNAEAGSVGEKYKTYLLELYGARFAISEAATDT
jgi:ATP-dependent Clp protease ATP-binding subunit ClpX